MRKRHWDYASHHLEYAAAAPAHQAHLVTTVRALTRPPPPPEDADDDAPPPPPAPVTLRMLDEHIPTLYVPSTANEPRARPLGGFPALGAYFAAAAVSPATGRYAAVIAADTLIPHGDGGVLAAADRAFIWDVACAAAARLDAFPAARVATRAAASGGASAALDAVEALQAALKEMRAPPPAEGGDGEEGDVADAEAAAPGDAEAEPRAEEAPGDDAEGVEDGDDGEQGADGEEGTVDWAKRAAKLQAKVRPEVCGLDSSPPLCDRAATQPCLA